MLTFGQHKLCSIDAGYNALKDCVSLPLSHSLFHSPSLPFSVPTSAYVMLHKDAMLKWLQKNVGNLTQKIYILASV